MRRLFAIVATLTGCAQAPTADFVEQAKLACHGQSRGVNGQTMTAPYDDCVAKKANRAPPSERARVCQLAAAGTMHENRCSIDTE